MRLNHLLFRGILIIAIASLAIACNNLLGMEDVSLGCYVDSDIKQIVSNSSTTLVRSMDSSFSSLEFKLNGNINSPAQLNVELFNRFGQHGDLGMSGTFDLTAVDAGGHDGCGICVWISFDLPSISISQEFWALDQGKLRLDVVDSNRLAGALYGLKLREVIMVDEDVVDVQNGCSVTIHDIEFDKFGTIINL